MSQPRALVAYCPDWPVVVSGHPPSVEVAVLHANRVVATSPAARVAGVRHGMRRREAQAVCPGLVVLKRDIAAEARAWEPVVAAIEEMSPGVEVLQPGQLALGSRGPSRFFGGDAALAAKVAGLVGTVVTGAAGEPGGPPGGGAWAGGAQGRGAWAGCCLVGVADGLFAAGLAALSSSSGHPLVVPPGATAAFLAPRSLKVLTSAGLQALLEAGDQETAALVDLLGRLGIRTMGDFAALPPAAVLSRFGTAGSTAHRLARGLGERAVEGRAPVPDWVVTADLDPPADQLQAAVFVGRALADEVHERLVGSGLVCTRLAVQAETEHGVVLRRSWRHDGALSAAAIGERVRWQLEGWALANQVGEGSGPSQTVEAAQAGRVTRIALVPEEVRPDGGRQLGFWGGDAGAESRASRAMARVQSMLGPESVLTGALQGGRDYLEQVLLVPWGEPRAPSQAGTVQEVEPQLWALEPLQRPVGTHHRPDGRQPGPGVPTPPPGRRRSRGAGKAPRDGPPPWPGRIPGAAPAVVNRKPAAARLLDGEGAPVTVDSRGLLGTEPALLALGAGGRPQPVTGWAGPWPLEERWWDRGGRRRARVQVTTADGRAYLLAREHRDWWVEAVYD